MPLDFRVILLPYLAGPARCVFTAPLTVLVKMRAPTYVLPRKGRGWRRCEHSGSVCHRPSSFMTCFMPDMVHDTHLPEFIHRSNQIRNYEENPCRSRNSRPI